MDKCLLKQLTEAKDASRLMKNISQEDKNQLSVRYEENKTMAAKEFYDKVIAKDIVLSEKTVNNFRKLFINLKIIE